ncbi:septum formation initiator family protein [Bacteriovorax stolpii]|uniref:Septum formation initiator n=1 Tax=Bacteriovorax stolpii TaxID=960 RepID=A0A2K9NNT8_BACTC|nr:hypothetical protein C0V70_03505 [Bacteriovorax stolpii]QDK42872.1 septum formation initiator family protein [Bacteriovorax stolpii]
MFALEFSFDRSRDALRTPSQAAPQPQTPPQPQAAAGPAQSAGVRPGPDLNTVDPSTIANERLRKAIERNRAKQASRQEPQMAGAQAAPQAQYQAPPAQPQPVQPTQEEHQQASFFNQPVEEQPRPYARPQTVHAEAQVAEATPISSVSEEPRRPRVRVRENVSTTPPPPPAGTSVVSRRSVAKPEDTEFVPVKRGTRKVASQISYTTSSATSRKKQKNLDPKYVTWLVKGSWIFCALMILRLIFANGGVTDFYSQKSTVNEKLAELANIKKENMQLVREIERMRSDSGFQKRLVRDNLGFIASDEFLVLFPKER